MNEKSPPWRRPVNILDPLADEQLKENGRQAKLLHKYGYSRWDEHAQRLLAFEKWGIMGIALANTITKIKRKTK